jgi:hypothetical protein
MNISNKHISVVIVLIIIVQAAFLVLRAANVVPGSDGFALGLAVLCSASAIACCILYFKSDKRRVIGESRDVGMFMAITLSNILATSILIAVVTVLKNVLSK